MTTSAGDPDYQGALTPRAHQRIVARTAGRGALVGAALGAAAGGAVGTMVAGLLLSTHSLRRQLHMPDPPPTDGLPARRRWAIPEPRRP